MNEDLEQYLLNSKAKRDKLKKLADKIQSHSKKQNFEVFPNLTPKRFKKYEESLSRNLIQMFHPIDQEPKKKLRSQSHPKKRGLALIYNISRPTPSKTLKLPPVKKEHLKLDKTEPSNNISGETSPSLHFSLIPQNILRAHYFNPALLTPVLNQKYLN